MGELYLTLAGLVVATLATAYSVATDDKSSRKAKTILMLLALAGLAAGVSGAVYQHRGAEMAEEQRKAAEKKLSEIQTKVGDVASLDDRIQKKVADLTALDGLGDGRYYVVIATFKANSAPDTADFEKTRSGLLKLFPDAEKNGLLWQQPVANATRYELRLGRHLTPSAAEIFRRLAADAALANGNPQIRRES